MLSKRIMHTMCSSIQQETTLRTPNIVVNPIRVNHTVNVLQICPRFPQELCTTPPLSPRSSRATHSSTIIGNTPNRIPLIITGSTIHYKTPVKLHCAHCIRRPVTIGFHCIVLKGSKTISGSIFPTAESTQIPIQLAPSKQVPFFEILTIISH